MSLITVEQVLAAGLDRGQVLDPLGHVAVVAAGEQHVGETEDAGERRANFVAHVGEELALGPVARFRRILGHEQVRLGSLPHADFLRKPLGLLRHFVVRRLERVEHLVERAIERAELVLSVAGDADRVIFFREITWAASVSRKIGREIAFCKKAMTITATSSDPSDTSTMYRICSAVWFAMLSVLARMYSVPTISPFVVVLADRHHDLDVAAGSDAGPLDELRRYGDRFTLLRYDANTSPSGSSNAGHFDRRLQRHRTQQIFGGVLVREGQHAVAVELHHPRLDFELLDGRRANHPHVAEDDAGGRQHQRRSPPSLPAGSASFELMHCEASSFHGLVTRYTASSLPP